MVPAAHPQVPHKKPAPDIYLLAAEELGVQAARCVVVEDSRIGVAAAKAAGMRSVWAGAGLAQAACVRAGAQRGCGSAWLLPRRLAH